MSSETKLDIGPLILRVPSEVLQYYLHQSESWRGDEPRRDLLEIGQVRRTVKELPYLCKRSDIPGDDKVMEW